MLLRMGLLCPRMARGLLRASPVGCCAPRARPVRTCRPARLGSCLGQARFRRSLSGFSNLPAPALLPQVPCQRLCTQASASEEGAAVFVAAPPDGTDAAALAGAAAAAPELTVQWAFGGAGRVIKESEEVGESIAQAAVLEAEALGVELHARVDGPAPAATAAAWERDGVASASAAGVPAPSSSTAAGPDSPLWVSSIDADAPARPAPAVSSGSVDGEGAAATTAAVTPTPSPLERTPESVSSSDADAPAGPGPGSSLGSMDDEAAAAAAAGGGARRAGPALRSYQREAIEAVLDNFRSGGITRQLVSMPTGAGKTITFAHIVKRMDCRTLILVHREQLMEQTLSALQRVLPGEDVGVVRRKKNEVEKKVVVATVQTASQIKRIELLSKSAAGGFGLCIIDEAHHAPAQSYQTVLDSLGFLDDANKDKLLLGVTATPFRRCSKRLLKDTFQTLSYDVTVGKLIEMGHLCKVRGQRILTYTDLSSLALKQQRSAAGVSNANDDDSDDDGEADEVADYNEKELSLVVNTAERNALVASTYLELAAGRKAIAFCCSIAHATDMARAFREAGVSAKALHSELPREEQAAVLAEHREGKIQVLTNVAILTEGYDDTTISCVLMSRPTRSPGLYTQCVGRGLRISPGKADCLVLDFTDRDHTIDRPSDLVTLLDIIDGEQVKHVGYERPEDWQQELKKLLLGGDLGLYNNVEFSWIRAGPSFYLQLADPKSNYAKQMFLQLRPCEPTKPRAGGGGGGGSGGSRREQEWQLLYTLRAGRSSRHKNDQAAEEWVVDDWKEMLRFSQTREALVGALPRALQRVEADLKKGLLRAVQELAVFAEVLGRSKRDQKWRREPATEAQKGLLQRYGVSRQEVQQWMAQQAFATLKMQQQARQGQQGQQGLQGQGQKGAGKATAAAAAVVPSTRDPWSTMTKGTACDALTLLEIEARLGRRKRPPPTSHGEGSALQVPATKPQVDFLRRLVTRLRDVAEQEDWRERLEAQWQARSTVAGVTAEAVESGSESGASAAVHSRGGGPEGAVAVAAAPATPLAAASRAPAWVVDATGHSLRQQADQMEARFGSLKMYEASRLIDEVKCALDVLAPVAPSNRSKLSIHKSQLRGGSSGGKAPWAAGPSGRRFAFAGWEDDRGGGSSSDEED